jgi:FAD synthetase
MSGDMKKILTCGVFDIVHSGHIRFLENCKKLYKNSKLIVVLSRDSTVLREKGEKPMFSENKRKEIMETLKMVDQVFLGNENSDKFKIVQEIKPDIIALGYDQTWDEKKLKKQLKDRNLDVEVVRLKKYGNIKSTILKEKLRFNIG